MKIEEVKKLGLPSAPGSYQFLNKAGQIIYIGKAVNLKNRVLSYWQKGSQLTPAKQRMITEIEQVKWIEVDSEIEALLLEANLVKKYQPYYNVDLRDDKRFIYINVSLADEVPGVFATRKIDKSGKYFGPFVSAQAVRETLKAIRKIWPYCTERKIKTTPCFYYQIGRCLGVCGGKISVAEYKRLVIKPIISFLSGEKQKILKDYRAQIKNYELKIKNFKKSGQGDLDALLEEKNKLEWQLKNMEQVLANAQVLSVGEKYANDVVELAKVLSLPKVPQRIEGYDLSNIFGQAAVGSMVVFSGGEPDKNEYRKFKIKILESKNQKIRHSRESGNPAREEIDNRLDTRLRGYDSKRGDTQMLEEILTRRFNNDWPLPDLIIVDGGKAQVNAAVKILKKHKLAISLIGISKGEGLRSSIAPDKLFFPGQTKALELPLNSPALHLIKRVRDEAHRFAITYHRDLRSRKMFNR